MTLKDRPVGSEEAPARPRLAYVDNLKVLLVAGVIIGHATMAWTAVGVWVLNEPRVRDPLLSILTLVTVVGAFFAMPLFFLLAGAFTPSSLQRKGLRRFLVDRTIRLGIPIVFFVIFLSPIVEYVDSDNAGWSMGFARFVPHIWWPPAPGPTWFLGVLLLFSIGYGVIRTYLPRRIMKSAPPAIWQLAAAMVVIALMSYAVRIVVPMGVEVWHLALAQTPGWLAGFTLGVIGTERGWLRPVDRTIAVPMRRIAWAAVAACVIFVGGAVALGANIEDFAGGGTWQSLAIAALEGVLIVAMPLWLIDLFSRRYNRQGPLMREMSRAAYAAFIFHQVVLVGAVLSTRLTALPPEIEFLVACLLGVAGSFALGSLLVRLPGVSKIL